MDLEGDFDPDEYDRKMKEAFDTHYYAEDVDDLKPECPEIEKELDIEPNWDDYNPDAEADDGPHCEDENFNVRIKS